MRELIERYVRELVKIPSTSNTETEKSCADYIAEELAKQPYFKEYPEQTGKYLLPEDSFGRSVPWGLVKGRNGSRKTIILTGHYDVVDTEEYGNERALAYDVEKWEDLVKSGNALPGMPEEVKKDFLSGDWMFGRGTADMKGGLRQAGIRPPQGVQPVPVKESRKSVVRLPLRQKLLLEQKRRLKYLEISCS